jgi:hypothetical protein
MDVRTRGGGTLMRSLFRSAGRKPETGRTTWDWKEAELGERKEFGRAEGP